MGSVNEKGHLLTPNKTNEESEFVFKNDLIMPERDIGVGLIIGRVALINENNRYILGANVLRLRPIKEINSKFLHQYINSNLVRKFFKRLVNGSAQLMITSKDVKTVILSIPCIQEQTKIANFLSSIDKKIELTTKELNSTKEFKKALLQQMFV
jgi:type I restriction enzyme, S subunit